MRLKTLLAGVAVVVTVGCADTGQPAPNQDSSASTAAVPAGTSTRTTVEGLAGELRPACQQVSTTGASLKGSLTCVATHDTAIVVVAPSRQELVEGINRGQLPPVNWVNRLVAGPNWYIIASSSRFAARLAELTAGYVGTLPGVRTVPAVAGATQIRPCAGANTAKGVTRTARSGRPTTSLRVGTIVGIVPPRSADASEWVHWHVLAVEGAANVCDVVGEEPFGSFVAYKVVSPGRVTIHAERDGGRVAQLVIFAHA